MILGLPFFSGRRLLFQSRCFLKLLIFNGQLHVGLLVVQSSPQFGFLCRFLNKKTSTYPRKTIHFATSIPYDCCKWIHKPLTADESTSFRRHAMFGTMNASSGQRTRSRWSSQVPHYDHLSGRQLHNADCVRLMHQEMNLSTESPACFTEFSLSSWITTCEQLVRCEEL